MIRLIKLGFFILTVTFFWRCSSDKMPLEMENGNMGDLTAIPYNPISFELKIPEGFPAMEIPADNPLTQDGIELGRMLFYDPILSSDSTLACASCHLQAGAFTDNLAVSPGVTGETGIRSSMSLLNVGFVTTGLFWDGRVQTLEEQGLLPVEDPIELHNTWPNVESKLQRHLDYPERFRLAFGIDNVNEITRELAVKAIAQFERTLISSGNSKYDRVIAGLEVFTDAELNGFDMFFDVPADINKHAECGHCHNAPLFTTNQFINNGIENVEDLNGFPDLGHGEVTNSIFDNGTFRVPSLRNIMNTAPFMHDGRFADMDRVIAHYVTGGFVSDNSGPELRPLSLSDQDKSDLKAFILTLQDDDFLQNPDFSSPF